jgi:asparaginyl-tRNA synthetase
MRLERLKIREVFEREPGPGCVLVRGWLRTRRESKAGLSFLEVNDGSCLRNLQVVAYATLPNYHTEIQRLTTGCSLEVVGELVESPGSGQAVELKASEIRLIGSADPREYPLQKKRHSFEFLREIAHLRSRTNTFGAVLRVRHTLSMAVHEFFDRRGFFYVHTPLITASDCEGAGQLFRVTTLDPERPPRREGQVDFGQDFFGRATFLTVSGQLEAEALACSLGDVYTFGPTFRAENSNTARHLSEFWMVEPEMAFCDLEGDMEIAEAFLKHLIEAVLNRCKEEMEFFDLRIERGTVDNLRHTLETPFERLSYTEAVAALQASGREFSFPIEWGLDMQTEHERYLTETVYKRPVIVYDYPRHLKPFYMYVNDDGKTVRAMDVLVPRIGEIIGGSQREHRYEVLLSRMREAGLDPENYAWYLDLRRFGSVPHAGFGLGFERLVQFVTGMANIRDVIPFPRTPGNAAF